MENLTNWIMTNLESLGCYVVAILLLITCGIVTALAIDDALASYFPTYERYMYGQGGRDLDERFAFLAKCALVLGPVNIIVGGVILLGYSHIKNIAIIDMFK